MEPFSELLVDVLLTPYGLKVSVVTPAEREWQLAADAAQKGLDYWCSFCLAGRCSMCSSEVKAGFQKCLHHCRAHPIEVWLERIERILAEAERNARRVA